MSARGEAVSGAKPQGEGFYESVRAAAQRGLKRGDYQEAAALQRVELALADVRNRVREALERPGGAARELLERLQRLI